MNNRAFGLRELLGREIDGVEDEDQLRASGSIAARESWKVRIFAGWPLSRRVKSEGAGPKPGSLPIRTTTSMLKRPSRTTGLVALRDANGFCATDRSRKGGVWPHCPASSENYHACEKTRALRVGSIHHDSTCITGAPLARGCEFEKQCKDKARHAGLPLILTFSAHYRFPRRHIQ